MSYSVIDGLVTLIILCTILYCIQLLRVMFYYGGVSGHFGPSAFNKLNWIDLID